MRFLFLELLRDLFRFTRRFYQKSKGVAVGKHVRPLPGVRAGGSRPVRRRRLRLLAAGPAALGTPPAVQAPAAAAAAAGSFRPEDRQLPPLHFPAAPARPDQRNDPPMSLIINSVLSSISFLGAIFPFFFSSQKMDFLAFFLGGFFKKKIAFFFYNRLHFFKLKTKC